VALGARVPLGKLTIWKAIRGSARARWRLDIAARVSPWASMPGERDAIDGGVVLLTAEDGLADTIALASRRRTRS